MSRFSQLIDETADQKDHSLSDVLLKAKVLASQLKARKFRDWIDSEINGYGNDRPLPDYRILRCTILGDFDGSFNSRARNVPIPTNHLDADIHKAYSTFRAMNSVAAIEDMVRDSADGGIIVHLDGGMIGFLRKYGVEISGMILNHARQSIPRHAMVALLNCVRSKLLDFLLELRTRYPELDKNDDAAINPTEIDAALDRKVYNNCTVLENSNMRDSFTANQAGAMGPNAKAKDINFVQILRDGIGSHSLGDLAAELERLRAAMLAESRTADQDQAVAAVAEAEVAAKKGDAKGVLDWLKSAGSWALDVGTNIGVVVATNAIEKAMGPQTDS